MNHRFKAYACVLACSLLLLATRVRAHDEVLFSGPENLRAGYVARGYYRQTAGGDTNRFATVQQVGTEIRLASAGGRDTRVFPALFFDIPQGRTVDFQWWFHRTDFQDPFTVDERIFPPGRRDSRAGYDVRGIHVDDPLHHPSFGRLLRDSSSDSDTTPLYLGDIRLIPGTYEWVVWWYENGLRFHKKISVNVIR